MFELHDPPVASDQGDSAKRRTGSGSRPKSFRRHTPSPRSKRISAAHSTEAAIAFISTASRGRRFRAVQSKIRTFKRLSLAAIILALLQIILSCVFGIIIWQLALIVLFGIITPLIELLSTRALHS